MQDEREGQFDSSTDQLLRHINQLS